MIVVTSELRARDGREGELGKQLIELAARVRDREPGCTLYLVTRSKHDPLLYLTIERYDDEDALSAHSHADHYTDALPALMECCEAPPRVSLFAGVG